MNILIIDSQGGGIGKQLISALKDSNSNAIITAVGTNTIATSAMLKAGADHAATGENAVVVGCRKANIIAGPVGIVIADALFGEITPTIAMAVGQSNATRILIPVNHCDNFVVGVTDYNVGNLVQAAVRQIQNIAKEEAYHA